MYIIHNLTTGTDSTCDALEFITARDGAYVPAEQNAADGFRALTIVRESNSREHYTEELFAFDGHTLLGGEPTGSWEDAPEEPDEVGPDEEAPDGR
ncbi:MAG: hypothetical protein IJ124_06060 [Clostridia bacterium]|nr:hypothetical protein [Clostridia bacterium]